jgi:hypothetical protein
MPTTVATRLAALATALAAAAALAGLLVPGLYVDAPNWVQQARGTDLATLFLAVPVLGLGLCAASRGSSLSGLAVLAGLLYLVYNYAIFAFSVAMNPLTGVHIAILGLSLWSLLLGGREMAEANEGASARLNRRAAGGLLVAVAGLFALLWLVQIAATSTTGVLPPDLVKAGISSNPVYAMDLAFFLPLCAIAGIGLVRRRGARAWAFPMLIWVALMGAGVLGGFLLMAAAGDEIPVPVVVVVTGQSIFAAVLATAAVVRPGSGATTRTARPAPHGRPPLSPLARASIVLEVILGIGALAGGLVLIVAPRGEIMPLPVSALDGSPFDTYLWPGVILFAVLGLGSLAAAGLALRRHAIAPLAAFAVGVALLIWVVVEIAIIGYSTEPPLQAIYLVMGVVITAVALAWLAETSLRLPRRSAKQV